MENIKNIEVNAKPKLTFTDDEVRALLDKIDDEGYTPTLREKAALKKVESIFLSKIPKSIDLLVNLQDLDLSNTQITSLSGIENLTNLQSLDLSNTKITDFSSIENLTNLQKLYLSNTQITNLSYIKNLTNLQTLNLEHTQITSLNGIENLANLQVLHLRNAQITNLSDIKNLTNLKKLSLRGMPITSLSGIDNLVNLQVLSLRDTQITSLSGIDNLANLNSLYLSGTQITSLSGIDSLVNLQFLYLSGTQITSLSGIDNLTNLQSIYLRGAQIASLSGIKNLTSLHSLHLGETPITSLSGIENLTNLQNLYLNGTQIDSNELERLSKLKKLTLLDLTHLKLTRIPHQLLELNLPFDTTSESPIPGCIGIYLYGTELTQQPLSLFEQDRSLIEEYYNSKMMRVGEAKVIFLGHGGVGKTHTIERIKEKGKFIKPIKGETLGISITSLNNFDGAGLNVQFWDFGGQDIMHSMHRCFLTERSCYVIVVNTRQGDVNKQARYWLNNIKSFAPNAPVILFENRWGKGLIGGGLDENRLKKEFPNIRITRSFSALETEKAQFNGQLVKDIRDVCSELDSVKMEFPEKWAKIREKLLELKDRDKPFIEKEDYYTLCRECGENSPDIAKWMLSWFNDLGVCFSYHQDRETNEELESYQLLAPNWIINAMYTIINNAEELCEGGIIYRKNIKNILKEGSASLARSLNPDANYADRTDYILEVMRKFQLSHKISDTKEFIPALCENNTPEDLHPDTWKKHVTYKYVYQFLPDNVVHQMMIFWKQERKHDPSKLWLKGFRIDYYPKGTAFVIDMGNDDNILVIDAYSLDDTSMFGTFKDIQSNIRDINSRLGLSPYESVSVEENGIKQDLPVNPLSKMWKNGILTHTILDQEDFAEIKLREVLEGIIEPEELRKAEEPVDGREREVTEKSDAIDDDHINEQDEKMYEIYYQHPEKITNEMLVAIAGEVRKQILLQPIQQYNVSLNVFANTLLEPSSEPPKSKLQKAFDTAVKAYPIVKDIIQAIIILLQSK